MIFHRGVIQYIQHAEIPTLQFFQSTFHYQSWLIHIWNPSQSHPVPVFFLLLQLILLISLQAVFQLRDVLPVILTDYLIDIFAILTAGQAVDPVF